MKDTEKRDGVLWSGGEPVEMVRALRGDLDRLLGDMGQVQDRQAVAAQSVMCAWPDQTCDGVVTEDAQEMPRDGEAAPGRRAGEMDMRVYMGDRIIRLLSGLAVAGFFRCRVQAVPRGAADMERAKQATDLLRWMVHQGRGRSMLMREVRLAARWCLADDPGLAVIGTFWHEDWAVERREVSLPEFVRDLAEKLMGRGIPQAQVAELGQNFAVAAMDEAQEDVARAVLRRAFGVDARTERMYERAFTVALERWRAGERAELPERVSRASEPRVVALRYGHDVFFDLETAGDIQRARVIYVREVLNDVELMAHVRDGDWDEEWAEEVLRSQRGVSRMPTPVEDDSKLSGVDLVHKECVEVWHAYRWMIREEDGYAELMHTVFHPGVGGEDMEMVGFHGAYRHPLGRYPFVLLRRELTGRGVTESRGVTWITGPFQTWAKKQLDALAFASELSAAPPQKINMRRAGVRMVLAPRAQIKVRERDDVEFMQLPPYPQVALTMYDRVLEMVDQYFGFGAEDPGADITLQEWMQGFIGGWAEVMEQMLALAQDNLTEPVLVNVSGKGRVVSREDIRGQYNVEVQVDPSDLNMGKLLEKLKIIFEYVLRLDRDGRVDTGPIVDFALGMLDPGLAGRVLRDEREAASGERAAAEEDLMKIFFGMQPELPDRGANFQVRMQTVQGLLQSGGKLTEELQGNERFAKGVQGYMRQLQAMVEQYEVNPQRGRQVQVKV